jgi:AcrR family transcriptional regulator
MSRQTKRSEATRARLIGAARALFAKRGYADVGTEEIVRRAKVTRGALYHHFADKKDLFRAVHEQIEEELTSTVAAQLAEAGEQDPLEILLDGTRTFLDHCVDPEVARISLMEAPGVLGWPEWRRIEERYGIGLVSAALQGAMDAGALRRQPVPPLAHVLLAGLVEAGLMIANSDDPVTAREEAEGALITLLEGLRP